MLIKTRFYLVQTIVCVLSAFFVALTATPAWAGNFGSMTYTTPAGWSEQQFQDGVVLKPSELPADEHLIIRIMPPLNFPGAIDDNNENSVRQFSVSERSDKSKFRSVRL
jgi:hypothetical protein